MSEWRRQDNKLVSPKGITIAVFKHPNMVALNDEERREEYRLRTKISRKIVAYLNSIEQDGEL